MKPLQSPNALSEAFGGPSPLLTKPPLGSGHSYFFTFFGSGNTNFKRLVLALKETYRHHLLGHESYPLGAHSDKFWAGLGGN